MKSPSDNLDTEAKNIVWRLHVRIPENENFFHVTTTIKRTQ